MADEHYWIALSSLKTEFPDVPVKEIQALMDKYRKGNKDLTTLAYTCTQFALNNPNEKIFISDKYVAHICLKEGKGDKVSLLEIPEGKDSHVIEIISTLSAVSFGAEKQLGNPRFKELIILKTGKCMTWWLECLPNMKLEERWLVVLPPHLGFPSQYHAHKMGGNMEDYIKIDVEILKIKD